MTLTPPPNVTEAALDQLEGFARRFLNQGRDAGTLSAVLTGAEVAWDAMIVWNVIRPDQTNSYLQRFQCALSPVVLRDETQNSAARKEGDAILRPIRFYYELATAGQDAIAKGEPVELDSLRSSEKRHFGQRSDQQDPKARSHAR